MAVARGPWLAGAVLAASVALQACEAADADQPRGDAPKASISAAGVRLTLTAERDEIPTGDDVQLRLDIRNVGTRAVLWWSGSCELERAIDVFPVAPSAPAAGREWPGDEGALKARLTEGSTDPAVPTRPRADDQGQACRPDAAFRADRGFNELPAGREIRIAAGWSAVTRLSSPLPPGAYRVRGTFPRVRAGGPLDPALVVVGRDVDPVVVELDIVVIDGDEGAVRPLAGEAADLLLSNPRFRTWLATHPAPGWRFADLRWSDGAWQFELRTRDGASARATIDPSTGVVSGLELDG